MSSHTVDIPQSIKDSLRKFRFRKGKGNAAMVIKINKAELIMELVETLDPIDSIEELAEELPENSPRFVILSYALKHPDGRSSFPLVLINWAPSSSEMGMMTLHASSLLEFQVTADVSKIIEIRDVEDLTTEAPEEKLLGK